MLTCIPSNTYVICNEARIKYEVNEQVGSDWRAKGPARTCEGLKMTQDCPRLSQVEVEVERGLFTLTRKNPGKYSRN